MDCRTTAYPVTPDREPIERPAKKAVAPQPIQDDDDDVLKESGIFLAQERDVNAAQPEPDTKTQTQAVQEIAEAPKEIKAKRTRQPKPAPDAEPRRSTRVKRAAPVAAKAIKANPVKRRKVDAPEVQSSGEAPVAKAAKAEKPKARRSRSASVAIPAAYRVRETRLPGEKYDKLQAEVFSQEILSDFEEYLRGIPASEWEILNNAYISLHGKAVARKSGFNIYNNAWTEVLKRVSKDKGVEILGTLPQYRDSKGKFAVAHLIREINPSVWASNRDAYTKVIRRVFVGSPKLGYPSPFSIFAYQDLMKRKTNPEPPADESVEINTEVAEEAVQDAEMNEVNFVPCDSAPTEPVPIVTPPPDSPDSILDYEEPPSPEAGNVDTETEKVQTSTEVNPV